MVLVASALTPYLLVALKPMMSTVSFMRFLWTMSSLLVELTMNCSSRSALGWVCAVKKNTSSVVMPWIISRFLWQGIEYILGATMLT